MTISATVRPLGPQARPLANAGDPGGSWRSIAIVVACYLGLGTELFRVLTGAGPTQDNPAGVKAAFVIIYLILLMLMVRDYRRSFSVLALSPTLSLLLLLPILSVLWSVNPDQTLVRAFKMLGGSLFGIYIAASLPAERLLKYLATIFVATAVLSFIFIFFLPAYGVHHDAAWPGAWRGVMAHKNGLGQIAGYGAVFLIAYLRQQDWQQNNLFKLGLGLNLLLLANSQSTTAITTFLFGAALLFLLPELMRQRRSTIRFLIIVVLSLIAAGMVVLNTIGLSAIAEGLGKSADMTGRLPIWKEVVHYINQRLWFGYGYSTFWEEDYISVRMLTERLFFKPSHAHNGILELWLNVGLAGVLLFAVLLVRYLYFALLLLRRNPYDMTYVSAVAYFALFALQNISEALIMTINSVSWYLFIAMFLTLARGHAALGPKAGQGGLHASGAASGLRRLDRSLQPAGSRST